MRNKEIRLRLERIEKGLQALAEAVNKRYVSDRVNDKGGDVQSILSEYLYGEDPAKGKKE